MSAARCRPRASGCENEASSAASVAAGVGARQGSRCSSPPQSSGGRGSVAVCSAPQFLLCTSSARNVTERDPASPDTLLLGTHTSPLLLHEKNGDTSRITPGAGFFFFFFVVVCLFWSLLLLLQRTGACPPSPVHPVCVRCPWTHIHRVHALKSPCMDTPWPRSCAGYSS